MACLVMENMSLAMEDIRGYTQLCFKKTESKLLQPQQQRSPSIRVKVTRKQDSNAQRRKPLDV